MRIKLTFWIGLLLLALFALAMTPIERLIDRPSSPRAATRGSGDHDNPPAHACGCAGGMNSRR